MLLHRHPRATGYDTLLVGNPGMKFIGMESHGLCGGSMGFRSRKGMFLIGLIRRHVL